MPRYTTGELAKLCGVTVRTVQYYDNRGILIPSEHSEGGRRLYSERDMKRMKIILFLRNLDIPINAISQILQDDHPDKVISLLIENQENSLINEIKEKQEKLKKLQELKQGLKSKTNFSLESINDIAVFMEDKKKLRNMRSIMILTGIPVTTFQWYSIIIWITKGNYVPFLLWLLIATVWGTVVSRYYFNHVKYICPECHEIFKPSLKEAFFARHTPITRKLTCEACGHTGFCIEIYGGDNDERV